MRIARAIDGSGDISPGEGFVPGAEAVANAVRWSLKLILGEYFRDITDGLDVFGVVLSKQASQQAGEAAIRSRIMSTDGVKSILAFELSKNIQERAVSIKCVIMTEYGETEVTYGEN